MSTLWHLLIIFKTPWYHHDREQKIAEHLIVKNMIVYIKLSIISMSLKIITKIIKIFKGKFTIILFTAKCSATM